MPSKKKGVTKKRSYRAQKLDVCACVQLSVLRVFQAILADSSFRRQPAARELVHTCTGITRNLFEQLVPRLPEVEESGELSDTWQIDLSRSR